MKKTFVLDTNVLLHNSNCIESFADNIVVIPMAVIEELDKFKSNNDELGRNARQVIRRLDNLRRRGRLGEGVPMDNGGTLKIIIDKFLPYAIVFGIAELWAKKMQLIYGEDYFKNYHPVWFIGSSFASFLPICPFNVNSSSALLTR